MYYTKYSYSRNPKIIVHRVKYERGREGGGGVEAPLNRSSAGRHEAKQAFPRQEIFIPLERERGKCPPEKDR